MQHKLRHWFCFVFCLLMALPVLAQDGDVVPKDTKNISSQPAPSGGVMAGIKELFKEWWLWGGIVAIIGLLGLLFYLRKQQEED